MASLNTLNVRLLAAVDMHGAAGTRLRRRLILAEFIVAAIGSLAIGVWMAASVGDGDWRLGGAWIAGVGVNYVALAVHAVAMSRRGALESELAGVDIGQELSRYSTWQLWIGVPFLFAVLALRQMPRGARPAGPKGG